MINLVTFAYQMDYVEIHKNKRLSAIYNALDSIGGYYSREQQELIVNVIKDFIREVNCKFPFEHPLSVKYVENAVYNSMHCIYIFPKGNKDPKKNYIFKLWFFKKENKYFSMSLLNHMKHKAKISNVETKGGEK